MTSPERRVSSVRQLRALIGGERRATSKAHSRVALACSIEAECVRAREIFLRAQVRAPSGKRRSIDPFGDISPEVQRVAFARTALRVLCHRKGAASARAVLPEVARVTLSARIEGIGLGVTGAARDLPLVVARGHALGHLAQSFSRPPAIRVGFTPVHTTNRKGLIEGIRVGWARFGNLATWVALIRVKRVSICRFQIPALVLLPIRDVSVEEAEPRAIVADADLGLVHPKARRVGIVHQNEERPGLSALRRLDDVALSGSRGRRRCAALEHFVASDDLTAPRSERCHDEQRENDGLSKHLARLSLGTVSMEQAH